MPARNCESTTVQDFEWHMNVTSVEWSLSLLGAGEKEKKGVPLNQVKIPEKALLLVVFIMNSYGVSFFGLQVSVVETINCLSLRF